MIDTYTYTYTEDFIKFVKIFRKMGDTAWGI